MEMSQKMVKLDISRSAVIVVSSEAVKKEACHIFCKSSQIREQVSMRKMILWMLMSERR